LRTPEGVGFRENHLLARIQGGGREQKKGGRGKKGVAGAGDSWG